MDKKYLINSVNITDNSYISVEIQFESPKKPNKETRTITLDNNIIIQELVSTISQKVEKEIKVFEENLNIIGELKNKEKQQKIKVNNQKAELDNYINKTIYIKDKIKTTKEELNARKLHWIWKWKVFIKRFN